MTLHSIQPVTVHARRAEVENFAAILGLGKIAKGTTTPWTYPAVWLAHPVVRQAILATLQEGEVPVHEAQEFIYAGDGVPIATDLVMRGDVRRDESRDKVRIIIDLRFEKDAATDHDDFGFPPPALVARLTCRLIAIRSPARTA